MHVETRGGFLGVLSVEQILDERLRSGLGGR